MIIRRTIHFLHRNDKSIRRSSARLKHLSVNLLAVYVLLASNLAALAASPYDSWYFTAEEVEAAHQYQENYGERMRNPLPARECLFGQNEFTARYKQTEFLIPCRFVMEATRHLKEMLAVGAAKYLFPLDADHAHLGIPAELWTSPNVDRRLIRANSR